MKNNQQTNRIQKLVGKQFKEEKHLCELIKQIYKDYFSIEISSKIDVFKIPLRMCFLVGVKKTPNDYDSFKVFFDYDAQKEEHTITKVIE